MARIGALIKQADPAAVEEVKYRTDQDLFAARRKPLFSRKPEGFRIWADDPLLAPTYLKKAFELTFCIFGDFCTFNSYCNLFNQPKRILAIMRITMTFLKLIQVRLQVISNA